jgi:hypothetical protein
MSSYLIKNYKDKYNLMAEVDKSTNDFCRDKDGNLDNYSDIWIECEGKCKLFHFGNSVIQFYCPSLGRGHNIMKDIYNNVIGSYDKYTKINMYQDKYGNDKESRIIDYESMYKDLSGNGIIFDIEETDEEVLFKFKAKDLDKLESYIKPKPAKLNKKGLGRSCFSVKNIRRQLGIKSQKSDIPIEKLAEYKQITSVIDKGNISIYNKINDGFLTVLNAKNHCSLDTLREEIKAKNYTTRFFIYSLGEKTWNEYLDYIKNFLEENL